MFRFFSIAWFLDLFLLLMITNSFYVNFFDLMGRQFRAVADDINLGVSVDMLLCLPECPRWLGPKAEILVLSAHKWLENDFHTFILYKEEPHAD